MKLNNIDPDARDAIAYFCEWLDKHDLKYQIEERISGNYYVRVIYPDGWYIRVSGFENPLHWYIRNMGEVMWIDIFSLTDLILKRKEASIKTGIKKAWLKGDLEELNRIYKEKENN